MTNVRVVRALLLALTGVAVAATPGAAATCESLALQVLPHVRITSATIVPAGSFQLPPGGGRLGGPVPAGGRQGGPAPVAPPTAATAGRALALGPGGGVGLGRNGGKPNARYSELQAFCRVIATLTPTPTSDIRAELWLPMTGWNGNFLGTSPNALGGAIPYASMANGLRDGFAVMGEDTGHRAAETNWMDDQERRIDFGHRAIHETTVFGKTLTNTFYETAAKYSYMRECGGGTTAALAAAQTYPEDYDGIVAGAFPSYWTRQTFGQIWPWYASHKDAASYIPPAKFPMIHQAVLQACDALDGVTDGVLEDPRRCTWNARTIACRAADGPNCLTAAQVETVRKVYQGPVNPRTGEQVSSPLYRGSELAWETRLAHTALDQFPTVPFFRSFVFKNPNWDHTKQLLDFDKDVTRANTLDISVINAFKPDLSPFIQRGGRLILVNGWSNAIVPPAHTLEYYDNVRQTIGARAVNEGFRLYMVPDMSECNGGAGTDVFDMFAVLRDWVEREKVPQEVIASKVNGNGSAIRTRPLCPYPQVAVYKGSGSTDEAANFSCQIPPR